MERIPNHRLLDTTVIETLIRALNPIAKNFVVTQYKIENCHYRQHKVFLESELPSVTKVLNLVSVKDNEVVAGGGGQQAQVNMHQPITTGADKSDSEIEDEGRLTREGAQLWGAPEKAQLRPT